MFNLLPNIFKEELKAQYKKRWLILLLILVIFLQVSFLIFLLPTWALSNSREKDIATNIDAVNNSFSLSSSTPIASIITDTNTKLNIISTAMQYPEVLPLVNMIISNKIPSIHINQIVYTFTNKSNASMTLSGTSDTRDSLVAFVKKLQASGSFKEVNLPVSNFTKDKNIVFSLDMNVSQ